MPDDPDDILTDERLPPGAETRADESDVAFKRRDPDERRIDVESGMPGHGARCCE